MSLLKSIRGRDIKRSAFGYGVTTADSYLKHIQACAGDEACLTHLPWSGAADAPGWDTVMKEAADKLVYSNEDTVVNPDSIITNSSDFHKTLASDETEVPPRTIMVFRNIITTPRKDRDGDVLRTDGAEIDSAMPLLWQHMHVAPIGRMLEIVDHSHDRLLVTSAVIDSPLGNDAANLIEFGALRISHGFIPKEFKEIEVKEGEMPGFDITKFEIMEESVVSVPSNTDAVIEAVSRGKLADPLVKRWAQHYYDNRPVVVSGVDSSTWTTDVIAGAKHIEAVELGDGYVTLTIASEIAQEGEEPMEQSVERVSMKQDKVGEEPNAVVEGHIADDVSTGTECTCDDEKTVVQKPFPNEHACRLADPDKFDDYRRDERESGGKVYSVIYGHNPDTDKWEEQAYRYLKEDWTAPEAKAHCEDHDGMSFEPATSGEESVDALEKGGRALSARNTKNIETAVELVADIAQADPDKVATRYRVLAKEAVRALTDVLGEGTDEDDKAAPRGDNTVESVAKQLLTMADDADTGLLRRVALVLSETADAQDRQREAAEFQSIIESVI